VSVLQARICRAELYVLLRVALLVKRFMAAAGVRRNRQRYEGRGSGRRTCGKYNRMRALVSSEEYNISAQVSRERNRCCRSNKAYRQAEIAQARPGARAKNQYVYKPVTLQEMLCYANRNGYL